MRPSALPPQIPASLIRGRQVMPPCVLATTLPAVLVNPGASRGTCKPWGDQGYLLTLGRAGTPPRPGWARVLAKNTKNTMAVYSSTHQSSQSSSSVVSALPSALLTPPTSTNLPPHTQHPPTYPAGPTSPLPFCPQALHTPYPSAHRPYIPPTLLPTGPTYPLPFCPQALHTPYPSAHQKIAFLPRPHSALSLSLAPDQL